jgi:predicted DNA-binding transcriptional regulator AlpA
MPRAPRVAWSYREACGLGGFSLSFLYDALKRGEGPQITKLGRRRLITDESLREWLAPKSAA